MSPSGNTQRGVDVLGIPFDANSSYLRGSARAPKAIRDALRIGSSNSWTEDGVDISAPGVLRDRGDIDVPDQALAAVAAIAAAVRSAITDNRGLICLGGDHSITYPVLKGFQSHFEDITILHFDAHPDLYDAFEGNRFSHASPFARIMEEGLVRRLVQVGIRTLNQHQREQASRFGVEIITMRNIAKLWSLRLSDPLYISFDVDVLDPAYAPGVSHYEPGGMTVSEVLTVIQSLRVNVVGADIVEYNPSRDRHTQTSMVCAKIFKEIAAAMLRQGEEPRGDWP